MTTVTTKDLPALHATTDAISAALEPQFAALLKDSKDDANVLSRAAYEALLPVHTTTGVTAEQAADVIKFNQHFFAGAHDAFAKASAAHAVTNQKVETTAVEVQMLEKDRLDMGWTKAVERNAGLPKDGQPAEKKTVYGTMTSKLIVTGSDTGVGELNKVMKRSKAAAQALFGNN